jgi:hypothetical protein
LDPIPEVNGVPEAEKAVASEAEKAAASEHNGDPEVIVSNGGSDHPSDLIVSEQ